MLVELLIMTVVLLAVVLVMLLKLTLVGVVLYASLQAIRILLRTEA